jgi:probable HAF family extracellular repeat protein
VLGGEGGTDSSAWGINASGQIAGYSETSGGGIDAVVWSGTTPTDLGSLGGTTSYGYAINASGQVVGDSDTTGNASEDGFLFTGGTMYDLNSIVVPGSGVTGIEVGSASDSINDLGQIAGYGTYEGHQVAVVLTPVSVPEPTSGLLLLLGSAATLLVHRRRTAKWVADA